MLRTLPSYISPRTRFVNSSRYTNARVAFRPLCKVRPYAEETATRTRRVPEKPRISFLPGCLLEVSDVLPDQTRFTMLLPLEC
eukprot:5896887-Pyramimonas_sp.AAC.2